MLKKDYRVRIAPFFYLSTVTLVGCSKEGGKFHLRNDYTNHNSAISTLWLDNGQEDPWLLVEPSKHDILKVIQYAQTAAENADLEAKNMEMHASAMDIDATCAEEVMVNMRHSGMNYPNRLLTILNTTVTDLKTVSGVAATITAKLQQVANIRAEEVRAIGRAASMLTSKVAPIQSAASVEGIAAKIETIQTETLRSIAAIHMDGNIALNQYITGEEEMTNRVMAYVDEAAAMQNVAANQIDCVLTYLRKLIQHIALVNYNMLKVKPDQAISYASAVQRMPSGQEVEAESATLANSPTMLNRGRDTLERCGSCLAQATTRGMTMMASGLTYAVDKGAEGISYAAPIAASAAKYAMNKGVEGMKYAAPIAASAAKYATVQGVKGMTKGVSYVAPIAASAAKYATVQGVKGMTKGVSYAAPIAASAAKYATVQGVKGAKYLYQQLFASYDQEELNREDRREAARRILGVTADADQTAIRRAYRREALQWHPDRSNAPTALVRFCAIKEAYNLLQV